MAEVHVSAGQRVIGVAEAIIIRAGTGEREYHYSLPYIPPHRLRARLKVRAWLKGMRPAGVPITIHQADRHGHVSSRRR